MHWPRIHFAFRAKTEKFYPLKRYYLCMTLALAFLAVFSGILTAVTLTALYLSDKLYWLEQNLSGDLKPSNCKDNSSYFIKCMRLLYDQNLNLYNIYWLIFIYLIICVFPVARKCFAQLETSDTQTWNAVSLFCLFVLGLFSSFQKVSPI